MTTFLLHAPKKMPTGALALDIDGTITTADSAEIARLVREACRFDFPVFINTARSDAYCQAPDSCTLALAERTRHHCLVHPDPPTSKVINMRKIQHSAGVSDPRNVILIDDRPENVEKVRAAGFRAIEVDASQGIRRDTVDDALRMMRHARRGCLKWIPAFLVWIVIIVCILCIRRCVKKS